MAEESVYLECRSPVSLIVFYLPNGEEALRIENDGKFYVKEKEIAADKEVVDALRAFLESQGYIPPRGSNAP